MEARIIIPRVAGEPLTYPLRLHRRDGREELKIVFDTSEENFDVWLSYLLRDVGAQIVTDKPAQVMTVLGLSAGEAGVVAGALLHAAGKQS